jgi:hypothetical protein
MVSSAHASTIVEQPGGPSARSAPSQGVQAAFREFGSKAAAFVALAWLGLLGDR